MTELIHRDGNRISVDTDLSAVVEAIAELAASHALAVARELIQQLAADHNRLVAQINDALTVVRSERTGPLTLNLSTPAEPRGTYKEVKTDEHGHITAIIETPMPADSDD